MKSEPDTAEAVTTPVVLVPPRPNRQQRRAAQRGRRQYGASETRDAVRHQQTHPLDTAPGRSAREWFAHLRGRLLASRPITKPASVREYPTTKRVVTVTKTGKRTVKRVPAVQRVEHPPVYGKPTFKNHINENGEHS